MESRKRSDTAFLWLTLVYPSVLTMLYFVWLRDSDSTLQQVVYSIGKIIQFSLPVLWTLAIVRQPTALRLRSLRGTWTGLGTGLLIAALLFAVYFILLRPSALLPSLTAEVQQKVIGLRLATVQRYVLTAIFYAFGHAWLEEYYWRWFVFRRCCALFMLPTAIILSAVGFSAHHVIILGVYFGWASPLTYVFTLCIALGGAGWAWLYHRSGSLAGPWLSHLLTDGAIFMIGYDLIKNIL